MQWIQPLRINCVIKPHWQVNGRGQLNLMYEKKKKKVENDVACALTSLCDAKKRKPKIF